MQKYPMKYFPHTPRVYVPHFQDFSVRVNFEKFLNSEWMENNKVDYRSKLKSLAKSQYLSTESEWVPQIQ